MLSKKVRGRNNVVIEKEHQFASRCSNAHIPGRACSAMVALSARETNTLK